jgi:hypothetical protein
MVSQSSRIWKGSLSIGEASTPEKNKNRRNRSVRESLLDLMFEIASKYKVNKTNKLNDFPNTHDG